MAPVSDTVKTSDRLRDATVDKFMPLIDHRVHVTGNGHAVDMTLKVAEKIGMPSRGPEIRQPFRLLFVGPLMPVLEQRIYHLEADGLDAIDLFMVPLGPEAGQLRYEAIFG